MIARVGLVLAIATGASLGSAASKPAVQTINIELKNHRFVPDEIRVPAGERIRFEVTNRDATADDFDSDDLHVDKDIAPHGKVAFVIGPLKAGSYAFKAELHAATAHGTVIAAESAR